MFFRVIRALLKYCTHECASVTCVNNVPVDRVRLSNLSGCMVRRPSVHCTPQYETRWFVRLMTSRTSCQAQRRQSSTSVRVRLLATHRRPESSSNVKGRQRSSSSSSSSSAPAARSSRTTGDTAAAAPGTRFTASSGSRLSKSKINRKKVSWSLL
ncbi:hypothetical protein GY45DRAFT_132746 [Cubamyces sp. BRFM 1775]|nr:hypothetical protein GY45DRAFT_132746 [Cubamyces sp. BRFM 1775]